MTRYLLDTNVVSDLVKPQPSARLLAWIAEQADDDLYIGAVTLAEIERGLLEMPAGRKRLRLEEWFSGPEGPLSVFEGHILPFDHKAGRAWAALMAEGKARGRPRDALDMMLAAIAKVHDCIIATDNERDFAGLDFINPLRRREDS